jgi:hypothetical protein
MKNKRIDILIKLYEKYKLSDKLPLDAKKAMLDSKKRTFIKILKREGKYSLFMFFVVSIFFWVKRVGITLSIAKSAIVVITAFITFAVVISTSSFYAYNHFKQPIKQIEQIKEERLTDKGDTKLEQKVSTPKKEKSEIINYQINVVPFEFEAIDSKVAQSITQKIVRELQKQKGKNAANIIDRAKKKITTDKLLLGSIVKIDETILITVKIMDTRSSKVLLYINEEAKSDLQVNAVCKRIAVKVAKKL